MSGGIFQTGLHDRWRVRLLPPVALCGLPFRAAEDVPLARTSRVCTVGIFALNIIIGGLIGGLALLTGLLFGVVHTVREII